MQPLSWRPRVVPTIAAGITIVAGLGVRAVLTGAPANVGGVALWSVLVACLIVWVRPTLSGIRVFGWCLGISVAVELFQLTPIPVGLYRIHRAFALVFGTHFQWADLPAYAIGSGIGGALQHARLRSGIG